MFDAFKHNHGPIENIFWTYLNCIWEKTREKYKVYQKVRYRSRGRQTHAGQGKHQLSRTDCCCMLRPENFVYSAPNTWLFRLFIYLKNEHRFLKRVIVFSLWRDSRYILIEDSDLHLEEARIRNYTMHLYWSVKWRECKELWPTAQMPSGARVGWGCVRKEVVCDSSMLDRADCLKPRDNLWICQKSIDESNHDMISGVAGDGQSTKGRK